MFRNIKTVKYIEKFVSSAKVLAAVPSITQPKRVYRNYTKKRIDFDGVGKELSTKTEMQSF